MTVIRQILIKNFRSIKNFVWHPNAGLNCLIGPGDSGKTTVLDAIDIALGARRSYPFTDADFYRLDTKEPIEISITVGSLEDSLLNLNEYGYFLRGFDSASNKIVDEPTDGHENVLTMRLTVSEDLDPNWQLFSERAEADGREKRMPWKHREMIAPTRLGAMSDQHLSWNRRSILNKLSEEELNVSSMLAGISRVARESFSGHDVENVGAVLGKVKTIAEQQGIPLGGALQAMLDVKGVAISSGAISIHDDNGVPLRQLGSGSLRLLISGLQEAASNSKIILVDEAEYGLEPFRINQFLNQLGSKDETPNQQVFITTHSPYVLRELDVSQLYVLRKAQTSNKDKAGISHTILNFPSSKVRKKTLEECTDAFFSRKIIVCEGDTEVGLVRGVDLYNRKVQRRSIYSLGGYYAIGGGDPQCLDRAMVFVEYGFQTAVFKDSDLKDAPMVAKLKNLGVPIFEWGTNFSTEEALINACPDNLLSNIVEIAVQLHGKDRIKSFLEVYTSDTESILSLATDAHRQAITDSAKKKSWFKKVSFAEELGENFVGPNFESFKEPFKNVIVAIWNWVAEDGGQNDS